MSIVTKTISELKDQRFFVPSYQRGYRWTTHEVKALLEDIKEFLEKGGNSYCLQPLIVKKREDGSYEVVDGQQRLTTIYILMKIVCKENPTFNLAYETRENSAKFLEDLSNNIGAEKEANIDFYHMANTYKTITKWLDCQQEAFKATENLKKIWEKVFFIWYEIPKASDSIALFTKVNVGKILLTNAELIKALLLNKDNFEEDCDKKQIEISVGWDRIEQGLRNDSFWYFLNEKEQSGTRIDMLFEVLAYEQNKKLPEPIDEKQRYFSFLVFSTALDLNKEDKEKFIKELWCEVERLYAEFSEWYADLDKYHIIGYLIASGEEIKDILKGINGERKSRILTALREMAKKTTGSYELNKISYDKPSDRRKIRKLLLLFNIATLVCKSEKQYRFPFDIYKGESCEKVKWDIEHIHATADETDEADDCMGNLTLLDASTNRSYQDKPFKEKRSIILEREAKGLFVPICTKNIFLKVYSKNVKDMELWGEEDKRDYLEAMEDTLKLFFNGGI